MAIQTTYTALNASAYASRASQDHDGWTPRFDEPEPVSIPSIRSLAAFANPELVSALTPQAQPQDTASLTSSIDTDDDELRGVFAEMAMDRQTRVAARVQMAATVQEDWTKTQEEVRSNEQMRQANMTNMWRSSFNPYGGGGMMPMPMPMPMSPLPGQMQPGMTPGMPGMPGVPQLGMQVSMPGQPQPGMPGAFPPGPAGTFSAFPGQPGAYPGQPGVYPNSTYPAPPGTQSAAMMGAPPYYYR